MGVPYRERQTSVIALIVDGNTDQIGALTGRLGAVTGVTVKSALTKA
jgi:putative iron-only hydrogenase system regulator